jgi:DNA-binding protein HU-beta
MIQKEDFVSRMSKKGYTKAACREIVDDFIATLEEILVLDGEDVMFRGFGTFEVKQRKEREAKNLAGEDVVVPAFRGVRFSPGKLLKREVKTGVLER